MVKKKLLFFQALRLPFCPLSWLAKLFRFVLASSKLLNNLAIFLNSTYVGIFSELKIARL